MSADSSDSKQPETIEAAAGAWLARRDRGLTAAEQDAYLQWLRDDPRHAAALARLEKTWGALDVLAEWRPAHSPRPNPDLLARPRWWRRWGIPSLALAAAVVVVTGIFWRQTKPAAGTAPAPIARGVRVIPQPERFTLDDGSLVDLNHGGKIETAFIAAERRVRLVRGEAHFTVAKNSARPFVVDAGAVAVRAIGTAFDVRREAAAVEVLVTEGKVAVEQPAGHPGAAASTPLVAGERAVVDTATPGAKPVISPVAAGEIERALAWQGVRLEFADLPLGEALAEFNLRNRQQVIAADEATAKLVVAGNFRADNVEAFVRVLELSAVVTVERRADGTTVLHVAK